MTKKERLALRNATVRKHFDQLCKKHEEWRVDAIIAKLEKRFFLSPRTIDAIIKREPGYDY